MFKRLDETGALFSFGYDVITVWFECEVVIERDAQLLGLLHRLDSQGRCRTTCSDEGTQCGRMDTDDRRV